MGMPQNCGNWTLSSMLVKVRKMNWGRVVAAYFRGCWDWLVELLALEIHAQSAKPSERYFWRALCFYVQGFSTVCFLQLMNACESISVQSLWNQIKGQKMEHMTFTVNPLYIQSLFPPAHFASIQLLLYQSNGAYARLRYIETNDLTAGTFNSWIASARNQWGPVAMQNGLRQIAGQLAPYACDQSSPIDRFLKLTFLNL